MSLTLKQLIVRAIEHSDFTIYGSDAQRIKRIINAIEDDKGRVTVEDALTVIKNRKQLDEVMGIYTGAYPLWLERLARGVIAGRIKLSGGQCKASAGVDVLNFLDTKERLRMQIEPDERTNYLRKRFKKGELFHNVDLLGLFDELHDRFKFEKGEIYQALAEVLQVPGHDELGSNLAYSRGAEKIRQDISKLKKQLSI